MRTLTRFLLLTLVPSTSLGFLMGAGASITSSLQRGNRIVLTNKHHQGLKDATNSCRRPAFSNSAGQRMVSTRLRGGATAVVAAATKTAYACAAFLGLHGLLLNLAPNGMMKEIYKIERPNNEKSKALSKDLLQVMESVAFGVGLLVALTIIKPGTMTMERAIGVSFLPRLFIFCTKIPIYKTQFLVINTFLMAIATGAMLTGKETPASKVFPAVSLAKAIFLRFKPEAACKKLFGVQDINAEEMKQSKALVRGLSNELMTTSVFQLLLSVVCMDATSAAGWTTILWVVLLADMGFVDQTWKLMDAQGPLVQVIHIAISALLATGFFLKW